MLRRKLTDLMTQRTAFLNAADAALQADNHADYNSNMEKVRNANTEIQRIQDLIEEQDRQFSQRPQNPAEARDMMEERGNSLMKGESVTFSVREVRQAIMNQTTLATGTIVQPTGAGSEIRDPAGTMASSIVDQVYVQDLTGMGAFLEPYVITQLDAKAGKVTANAGTARTASDPTFGVAKISPYEMNVTSFVDRNISRLSPANYFQKIHSMAMLAMRRKLAELIANGDGQASPDFFGILNAKNVAGANIFASQTVAGVDENLLDSLFFAYGSDEAIGQNARLYLTKADLAALGKLRNDDKQRVFRIKPEGGNPNVGVIEDGGVIIPYTILPSLKSLATASSGEQTMAYGDPMNFEVGMFGEYSIRVDESVKGVERMLTILGDAMVGGNLIRHNGFVVATKE